MKIETLKEFEAVLKVCRKHGVTTLTLGDMSLQITEQLEVGAQSSTDTKEVPKYSDEDLLMWSSSPQIA